MKRPAEGVRAVAEFWVEASTKPQKQERTIVRVGKRELRVGLLNGIKPAGADQVIAALVSGQVRYRSDNVKERVSRMDFSRPESLGISAGECWISFSSPGPLTGAVFRVQGKDVVITGAPRGMRKSAVNPLAQRMRDSRYLLFYRVAGNRPTGVCPRVGSLGIEKGRRSI